MLRNKHANYKEVIMDIFGFFFQKIISKVLVKIQIQIQNIRIFDRKSGYIGIKLSSQKFYAVCLQIDIYFNGDK